MQLLLKASSRLVNYFNYEKVRDDPMG
jgi:hypothetical protein